MIDWDAGKSRVLVELVGAAAVLLGLLFVGYELRQNTAAVQSSTLQSMVDLSTNYLIDVAMDPEFVKVLNKAVADPHQLDETESQQIQTMIRGQWLRYQSAFSQWRRGSLGEADWEIYQKLVCVRGEFGPIHEYFWPVHRRALTTEFLAYVEECRSDLHEVEPRGR